MMPTYTMKRGRHCSRTDHQLLSELEGGLVRCVFRRGPTFRFRLLERLALNDCMMDIRFEGVRTCEDP